MRLLLATPDYPPQTGGIQLLLDQLVRNSRFRFEVLTPRATPGARPDDSIRTPLLPDHRATIAALNAMTVSRAAADRPAAVLSGHVVTGPGAVAVQTLFGVPAIQYLHGQELGLRHGLTRSVTRRCAASVAVSSYTRDRAIALGAPAHRVRVILPGIEASSPSCADAAPGACGGDGPLVLTVARLRDRYKGFDVMIKALPLIRARAPGTRWVVIGEGPLQRELEAMAVAYGVGCCVTFTGSLDDAARDAWLDRADVFAMPSRITPGGLGGEGFGLVYLEAAAHGLPCVAADVGGSTDAVIDGETGLTVDPTDHVAVADAIAGLLIDPERRARLGAAARARAAELSWGRMAAEVDELIERVVACAR
jgi:phosphatidylinositol alpha-1,6-mannosyltransferase